MITFLNWLANEEHACTLIALMLVAGWAVRIARGGE
jgi:hypothetical protein